MENLFWKNKKILITGHTGFKGAWLTIMLYKMGADIAGYALDTICDNGVFHLAGLSEKIGDFRGDIRDFDRLEDVFKAFKPDIVFHLAAQPLVIESYKNPRETYDINMMGTVNVLENVRLSDSVKAAVIITSDKCYENNGLGNKFVEDDRFGGHDPYSSSKGCCELIVQAYRDSFFRNIGMRNKGVASARAGNVIGGGDWAENRIVPDCIRTIEANDKMKLRNPHSIRPWQHVLEPLSGYISLAQKLYEEPNAYASGWNFGPYEGSSINVKELTEKIFAFYGKGEFECESVQAMVKEDKTLLLGIDKAINLLEWRPVLTINQAIQLTVEWYKKYKSVDVYDLCSHQIEQFYHMKAMPHCNQ